MVRHPPDILITTPESLYLMLTSQAREIFEGAEQVIVEKFGLRGKHIAAAGTGNETFTINGTGPILRDLEVRQALALAYSIDRNTWRGESTVELHVADLQAGTSSVPHWLGPHDSHATCWE